MVQRKGDKRMRRQMGRWVVIGLAMLVLSFPAVLGAANGDSLPVKGKVTMIDLGARGCLPCRLMEPILDAVRKEFKDEAVIRFIDVSIHRDQIKKYRLRGIPTQIFFDPSGREVYRHIGFLEKEQIVRRLERMGVRKKRK